MLCFICNHEAVLLIPDRDPDSMVVRPICDKCLDDFIKIFPNLFKYVKHRQLGLIP